MEIIWSPVATDDFLTILRSVKELFGIFEAKYRFLHKKIKPYRHGDKSIRTCSCL